MNFKVQTNTTHMCETNLEVGHLFIALNLLSETQLYLLPFIKTLNFNRPAAAEAARAAAVKVTAAVSHGTFVHTHF